MTRVLPSLNALKAFEAAGRHKSFSKAGKELNVSHTSISRHIRGLEERLGTHLFSRVSKGVEISPGGKQYLDSVTAAFDLISEATDDLCGVGANRISISCESNFAVKWLMPKLGEFTTRHPEIEMVIDATHSLANLTRYECDVALRFCRSMPQGVESVLISSTPAIVVGAPKFLGSRKGGLSPVELLETKLIVESHNELWSRWFDAAGVPIAERPQKKGNLPTMMAIEAALGGQGVALTSRELVQREIEEGRLVQLSAIDLTYGEYRLLYLKQAMRRKSVREFRDWLLEESAVFRP